MTASDLTDGLDITDSEDIGMTAFQVDTEEVGLKVILTDKLARQLNEDVFAMVGRQVGDAMARKKDTDLLDLFNGLGGSADGADAITLAYYQAVSSILRAVPSPLPIVAVLHPYQAHILKAAVAPSGTYPIPGVGISADVIKQWQVGTWAAVPCYEDGNITCSTTAHGAMFSTTGCMGYLQSQADTTERERDASLRATELVIVCDYEAFEIDDNYGYDMFYTCVSPTYYTT